VWYLKTFSSAGFSVPTDQRHVVVDARFSRRRRSLRSDGQHQRRPAARRLQGPGVPGAHPVRPAHRPADLCFSGTEAGASFLHIFNLFLIDLYFISTQKTCDLLCPESLHSEEIETSRRCFIYREKTLHQLWIRDS